MFSKPRTITVTSLLTLLTRLYLLCASFLLFFSSNVLAAPEAPQREFSVSIKNTANLTQCQAASREEYVNAHRHVMQRLSSAASQQKAVAVYHNKAARRGHTSTANHGLASLHHSETMDGLHQNLRYHSQRVKEIEHGAQGSHKDLANIQSSHDFATKAIENAAGAKALAEVIAGARKGLPSKRDKASKPALQAYKALTKEARSHAGSEYEHMHSLKP